MENEKEKYFAAHWGQEVAMVAWPPKGTKIVPLDDTVYSFLGLPVIHCADYIELTSLSDITDDDAIKVAKILFPEVKNWQVPYRQVNDVWIDANDNSEIQFVITDGFIESDGFLLAEDFIRMIGAIDYLRSKSYALPFNGNSVEELIELGWLKIKK